MNPNDNTQYIPRYNLAGVEETQLTQRIEGPKRPGPRGDRVFIACIVLFVAVMMVVAGLFVSSRIHSMSTASDMSKISLVDSGVQACQAIAKNAASNTSDNSDSKPMTKAELVSKSAPFKNSQYTDLQVAGVDVMNTVYKMDNNPDDAVGYLSILTGQWSSLQVACANHKVTIPGLTDN